MAQPCHIFELSTGYPQVYPLFKVKKIQRCSCIFELSPFWPSLSRFFLVQVRNPHTFFVKKKCGVRCIVDPFSTFLKSVETHSTRHMRLKTIPSCTTEVWLYGYLDTPSLYTQSYTNPQRVHSFLSAVHPVLSQNHAGLLCVIFQFRVTRLRIIRGVQNSINHRHFLVSPTDHLIKENKPFKSKVEGYYCK